MNLNHFTSRKVLLCTLTVLGSSVPAFAARGEASADDLQTLPGFQVSIVAKADAKANGSWISMSKDDQGRLLLGGQRGQPATRITLGADGKVAKDEILKLPVSEIMGQLFVDGALYVDAAGRDGKFGLYRLRDPKGDGSFDSVEMLREWQSGAGEHGSHGIRLGRDHKLYLINGNFTGVPTDLAPASPHKNYQDDLALPRAEDGNGFGAGKKPPGGYICRLDLDGKNAELFASGQRNTYDIDFNPDGELFGFDSDMEWDWGTPWYRPIRVFHATGAGDGGFREGTAKWPTYYADSLPPVQEIGIGCPTGVAFGTGAKFPAKYQKAFYINDWTYGRLIAVHMKPHGSTYESTGWENFVAPKSLSSTNAAKTPLNLTDIVIGNDGALYFTVGGRNTQAYLYRVAYTGSESTAPVDPHDADGAGAREQRHMLESFHGRVDGKAVETAWPFLASDDRFLRYAARIAIEAQPVEHWKDKALSESKPQGSLTALLALARLGGAETQKDVLGALSKLSIASLSPEQQMDKLRVIEVSIARGGKPSPELAKPIVAELDPLYPAKTVEMNRELCQVLLALNAPDAVAKTVKLLDAAPTQEEQLNYLLALRTIKAGWTPELRRAYLGWWNKDHKDAMHPEYVTRWFQEAGRAYGDGASFPAFLNHLHDDARNSLSPEEERQVSAVLAAYTPLGTQRKKTTAKARTLVKEWTMADLESGLDQVGKHRSFAKGKAAFEEAQCINCHRFGNEGGAVGPDLTAVSSRFQRRDILESIIDPSKVVSEQYMNTAVRTKGGETVVGRVVEETNDKIVLQPDALKPEKVTVSKADVQVRKLSPLSPMPAGLVNGFTKDEIYDLIAYMESAGHRDHPDFAKAK